MSQLKETQVTCKMLEFILTQVEKEYHFTIKDVKEINLNNDAMYCKLFDGQTKVVMLYPNENIQL